MANNPIIGIYETIDPSKFKAFAYVYDFCNSTAWDKAGQPDDGANSQWQAWENEAWRVLYRRFDPVTYEACKVATEHVADSDHRWQECPLYAED